MGRVGGCGNRTQGEAPPPRPACPPSLEDLIGIPGVQGLAVPGTPTQPAAGGSPQRSPGRQAGWGTLVPSGEGFGGELPPGHPDCKQCECATRKIRHHYLCWRGVKPLRGFEDPKKVDMICAYVRSSQERDPLNYGEHCRAVLRALASEQKERAQERGSRQAKEQAERERMIRERQEMEESLKKGTQLTQQDAKMQTLEGLREQQKRHMEDLHFEMAKQRCAEESPLSR